MRNYIKFLVRDSDFTLSFTSTEYRRSVFNIRAGENRELIQVEISHNETNMVTRLKAMSDSQ